MWFRKYRILIVVYTAALLVGAHEVMLSRTREPFGWLTPRGQELMDILAVVNPEEPDVEFLQGMKAFAEGDGNEFFRRMDEVLESNVKHDELILRAYAQGLVDAGADWRQVTVAVNRWRENFPFSRETLTLYLPPERRFDIARMQRALEQIPWIADSRIVGEDASAEDDRGRLELMFRRGYLVDVEDALAAIALAEVR